MSGRYCLVCFVRELFVRVPIVRFVLSRYILSGISFSGIFCPGIFYLGMFCPGIFCPVTSKCPWPWFYGQSFVFYFVHSIQLHLWSNVSSDILAFWLYPTFVIYFTCIRYSYKCVTVQYYLLNPRAVLCRVRSTSSKSWVSLHLQLRHSRRNLGFHNRLESPTRICYRSVQSP